VRLSQSLDACWAARGGNSGNIRLMQPATRPAAIVIGFIG
jgi:hypothetical protein